MKNLFIKFILIFFIVSCGGDESSSEVVIPEIPSIIVDKTSISFDDTMVSKSSSSSSVFIESKNVSSNLNITSSDFFEISSNNLDFSNSITLEANESKTIYVRFSPNQVQNYSGNIARSFQIFGINIETPFKFQKNLFDFTYKPSLSLIVSPGKSNSEKISNEDSSLNKYSSNNEVSLNRYSGSDKLDNSKRLVS